MRHITKMIANLTTEGTPARFTLEQIFDRVKGKQWVARVISSDTRHVVASNVASNYDNHRFGGRWVPLNSLYDRNGNLNLWGEADTPDAAIAKLEELCAIEEHTDA